MILKNIENVSVRVANIGSFHQEKRTGLEYPRMYRNLDIIFH